MTTAVDTLLVSIYFVCTSLSALKHVQLYYTTPARLQRRRLHCDANSKLSYFILVSSDFT